MFGGWVSSVYCLVFMMFLVRVEVMISAQGPGLGMVSTGTRARLSDRLSTGTRARVWASTGIWAL